MHLMLCTYNTPRFQSHLCSGCRFRVKSFLSCFKNYMFTQHKYHCSQSLQEGALSCFCTHFKLIAFYSNGKKIHTQTLTQVFKRLFNNGTQWCNIKILKRFNINNSTPSHQRLKVARFSRL